LKKDELFKQYQKHISDLVRLIHSENNLWNNIAQEERNSVAEIENEYSQISLELQRAKQTITDQYRSVRESCALNAGLRRPEEQHSSYIDKDWKECIRIQEQAAKEIQNWIKRKTQQAVDEKRRKLQQEEKRKASCALAAAEAERKRKEEAALLEEAHGADLLEQMKRKYRGKI